jgi:hypothetical protein
MSMLSLFFLVALPAIYNYCYFTFEGRHVHAGPLFLRSFGSGFLNYIFILNAAHFHAAPFFLP